MQYLSLASLWRPNMASKSGMKPPGMFSSPCKTQAMAKLNPTVFAFFGRILRSYPKY